MSWEHTDYVLICECGKRGWLRESSDDWNRYEESQGGDFKQVCDLDFKSRSKYSSPYMWVCGCGKEARCILERQYWREENEPHDEHVLTRKEYVIGLQREILDLEKAVKEGNQRRNRLFGAVMAQAKKAAKALDEADMLIVKLEKRKPTPQNKAEIQKAKFLRKKLDTKHTRRYSDCRASRFLIRHYPITRKHLENLE